MSTLRLTGSGVDPATLSEELRGRSLDRLHLVQVNLSGDPSGLVELSCTALTIVGVSLNDTDLAGIGRNKSLRRLVLSGTDVTDKIVDELVRLPLEYLDLGDTSVTDAGVAKLVQIETLQWLNLEGTEATDDGLTALTTMKDLCSLEVSLGNGVTRAGLKGLKADLPACEISYVDASGAISYMPAATP